MPDSSRNAPVRFRLAHIGLWFSFAFIFFAINHMNSDVELDSSISYSLERLFHAFHGLVYGALSAGAIVLLGQILRGKMEVRDFCPGHWQVVVLITPLITHMVVYLILVGFNNVLPGDLFGRTDLISLLFYFTTYLLPAIVCVIATRNKKLSKLWNFFFFSQACLLIVDCTYTLLGYPEESRNFLVTLIPNLLSIPCLLLMIFASYRDSEDPVLVDWIHWVGIAAFLTINLWGLFWNVIGWRLVWGV